MYVRIALVRVSTRETHSVCEKRKGGVEKERGREGGSTPWRGKSAGGGAFHKSIPTLNPVYIPTVHDARNVSPTDPNPIDDIAAARTDPAYVVAAALSRASKC